MDVRVGLWRRLSAEELMLLNCGVGEDSCESLAQKGDQTSQSWRKSTLDIHWKDWCWSWRELDQKEGWAQKNWCFSTVVLEKTLETPLDCKEIQSVNPKGNQSWISFEGLMLKLKLQSFGHLMRRTDSLEKTLMLGKIEGRRRRDNRGWDGWMASLTQWTWVLVDSGSWWQTGGPGMLRSMELQKVGHDWATELNWTEPKLSVSKTWLCSIEKTQPSYWCPAELKKGERAY